MEVAEKEASAVRNRLGALAEPRARPAERAHAWAGRVVYVATAAYALLFVGTAIVHFESFHAGRADLGWMAQAVWSTAHGHFLESTTLTGDEVTRLAGHVDPFLALLVPAWWVWPSPLMLLVVQAVAVSSGALPVFWLARKHLGSRRAAVAFALAYLLFPATQWNALTLTAGFHPVSMAVPLILFAIWFLDEDRLVLFSAFALLAASTKEEIPAAVGCLGIWYAVRKGRRLFGATVFALGMTATLVNFLVVIPHFSPTGVDPFAHRYVAVGGTPTGILHKALTNPAALLHAVATGHKAAYLALLLAPFLGLWAREPLLLLGAVPDLAINLLSAMNDQTSIAYYWTAGIVPFLFAATVVGAGRLRRRQTPTAAIVVAVTACIALVSPIYLSALRGDFAAAFSGGPARAAKVHALDVVPSGVPVSASNQLATYISARRFMYIFPDIGRAKWLVLDRADSTYTDRPAYRAAVRRALSDPRWMVVYSARGVEVLRERGVG
jgi:uncharacterized membrane protein